MITVITIMCAILILGIMVIITMNDDDDEWLWGF